MRTTRHKAFLRPEALWKNVRRGRAMHAGPSVPKTMDGRNPPMKIFRKDRRSPFLLAALLAYILITPALENRVSLKLLLDIFMTVILLSGIYAVCEKKWHIFVAGGLGLPAIGLIWLNHLIAAKGMFVAGNLLLIAYLAFVAVRALTVIIHTQRVTVNVISDALVVYLVLGIIWALAYGLLESWYPGSVSLKSGGGIQRFDYLYFSFTTLTTLGYGDITPLTDRACALTIVEAVIGQFYLAVLIASLVGRFIAQERRVPPTDGHRESRE